MPKKLFIQDYNDCSASQGKMRVTVACRYCFSLNEKEIYFFVAPNASADKMNIVTMDRVLAICSVKSIINKNKKKRNKF